jgi:hypothetical protein
VRGAIVVRMNSLIRGHSGVRWELIEKMGDLLRHNITPMVPLRGSISASGGKISIVLGYVQEPESFCSKLQICHRCHILRVLWSEILPFVFSMAHLSLVPVRSCRRGRLLRATISSPFLLNPRNISVFLTEQHSPLPLLH